MKRYSSTIVAALSAGALALFASNTAEAHGHQHHAFWHGDRITMTWTVEGVNKVYDVRAPVNPPLRFVKRHFMAKAGLPERQAGNFVVEKVVTILPVRDPNIVLPPGAIPRPVMPVTEYLQLDESKSLKALGVVDGDTLRLRQVATATADNDTDMDLDRHPEHSGHHGH